MRVQCIFLDRSGTVRPWIRGCYNFKGITRHPEQRRTIARTLLGNQFNETTISVNLVGLYTPFFFADFFDVLFLSNSVLFSVLDLSSNNTRHSLSRGAESLPSNSHSHPNLKSRCGVSEEDSPAIIIPRTQHRQEFALTS